MKNNKEKWGKNNFGERLQGLRKQLFYNRSAREMSKDLGRHKNYINSIEAGKSYPSMEVFLDICDYLKLAPEKYFGKDEEEDPMITIINDLLKQLSPIELHLLLENLRKYLSED